MNIRSAVTSLNSFAAIFNSDSNTSSSSKIGNLRGSNLASRLDSFSSKRDLRYLQNVCSIEVNGKTCDLSKCREIIIPLDAVTGSTNVEHPGPITSGTIFCNPNYANVPEVLCDGQTVNCEIVAQTPAPTAAQTPAPTAAFEITDAPTAAPTSAPTLVLNHPL